jgi:hypothetical protein
MKTLIILAAVSTCAMAQSADTVESFYRSGGPSSVAAKSGETLFHIAARVLGDPYQASVLQKLNGIGDPLKLEDGQKIKIAAPRRGILYSFQKLENDCDISEVNENYRFRNGDRFQFRMASNFDGYLYLYNQTSNGRLEQLFAGEGAVGKQIQAFRDYIVPRQDWFRLDAAKGPEELVVLIAQEPLGELDREMIADDVTRAKIKSYAGDSTTKGITVDSTSADRGRSLFLTSPIEGTKVFAHRIVLQKETRR